MNIEAYEKCGRHRAHYGDFDSWADVEIHFQGWELLALRRAGVSGFATEKRTYERDGMQIVVKEIE